MARIDTGPTGPLQGLRVVELAGQGPGPFAAMMFSDMGAEVLKVDRADGVGPLAEHQPPNDIVFQRGRRSIALDLKQPGAAEVVLRLVERADALIEGFRPGVVERLGIGPDACWERNPRLVYGRMTGWGQDGPWEQVPAHDINYVAMTGLLNAIGTPETPVPPLNLVGDFGGGGMYLAFGLLAGIVEAQRSGEGQVVDANMLEGVALLGGVFYGMLAQGRWSLDRGTNLLDGGAPFYGAYETSDGRFVSVGPIEPKFYAELLIGLGLDPEQEPDQYDRSSWPGMKAKLAAIFRTETRDHWSSVLEPRGVCFAPVLTLEEAVRHEHAVERDVFVEFDGAPQPGPTPRFSRTPAAIAGPSSAPGQQTTEALTAWGFDGDEVAALLDSGIAVQAS